MKLRLGLFALVWLSTLGTPATAFFQPQDITIPAAPSAATTSNPILFVTQPPVPNDTLTVATTFGNQRGEPPPSLIARFSDHLNDFHIK